MGKGGGVSRISGKFSREGDLWTEFGGSDKEFSKWNKVWKRIFHRGPASAQKIHLPGGLDHGHVSPQHSMISLISLVIVTCSRSIFPTESWVQTEAMSYLFLYSQHVAHAWHAVRIPNKIQIKWHWVQVQVRSQCGLTSNPCQPFGKSLQFTRTGLERGDNHGNSLLTVKNEVHLLLLVQK